MSRQRYPKNGKNRLAQIRLDSDYFLSWRLDKQLNQHAAAKRCGISRVTFSRLEAGKPVMALTAARVAKKLGLKLSDLRLS